MYVTGDVLNAIRDAHAVGITEGVIVLHPVAFNDLRQSSPSWTPSSAHLCGYRFRVDPDASLAIELVES